MHIKAKVVARRFLVRIDGRLHRLERRYRHFFDKRQALKARKQETKGIFVDLNVRYHSHQQMDTNFGRFKMLALRNMAGDEVKDDVNNVT